MVKVNGAVVLLVLMALVAVSVAEEKKDEPKEVVINIIGDDDKAEYREDGKDKQEPVAVVVGQKVKWVNKGKFPHTATSKKKDGKMPLFDTKRLKKGESKSIDFDDKLFEKAGGKPGEEITLDYFCAIHGEESMKSSLKLKSPKKKDK